MGKGAFKLVRLIAVIALFVLALGAASTSANSASATISFAGNATLLTNGALSVNVHYSCLPPDPGQVVVFIDETGAAEGQGFATATCDDKNHSVTVTVTPFFGTFTPGTASALASVNNGDFASRADTQAEIAIK
jgi:hypothetical protein